MESLSKTYSKDALLMKFRKANLKNIGIQNMRKNVKVTNISKFKLLGSSKAIWNQNLNDLKKRKEGEDEKPILENVQRNNFFTA
jgi:hypothetical protein